MKRRTLLSASAIGLLGAATWLRAHNHGSKSNQLTGSTDNNEKTKIMSDSNLQTDLRPNNIENAKKAPSDHLPAL